MSRLAEICEAFPLESSVLSSVPGPGQSSAESSSGCIAAAARKKHPLGTYSYLQSVHLGKRDKLVKS